MAEHNQGLTKRDIFHIFFKYSRMIACVVLVTMLLTLLALLVVPKQYEVKSDILFKAPRMELSNLYDNQRKDEKPYVNIAISEMINAEVPILESPALLRQVIQEDIGVEKVLTMGSAEEGKSALTPVKKVVKGVLSGGMKGLRGVTNALGFTRKMTPEDQALDKIQRNLDVVKVQNSNSIQVVLKCEDPKIGADIVNSLIKRYERRHAELYELAPQDLKFFEVQVTQKKDELTLIEKRLREIREKYNMANPKSVYDAKLMAMGNLQQMLTSSEARLSALEERHKNYSRFSNASTGQFAKGADLRSNPNLNEIMKSLLAAQEKYDEAATRYASGSFPLIAAKKEYEQMQVRFRQEVESTNKGDELEATEVQGSIAKYQKAIADLEAEIRVVQANETEYERLLMERDILNSSYKEYSDQLERARTSEKMNAAQVSNVAQIAPAIPPIKPSSPKVDLVLMVAFILSVMASFGLLLLIEYLNQTYRSDEDIEKHLGLRVVTSLPEL